MEKGLYIEVRPNGSKLWFLKYRVNGKEKRLGLGSYPDVSLADARKARDAARIEVQAGRDPLFDRKMAKIEKRIGAVNTFQSVAEDFIATKLEANNKAESTISKARWFLSHLSPSIGARPIAEIEPAELLAALKKIENRGHRETAVRTRNFASRVFRHGVATARCKRSYPVVSSQLDAASMPKETEVVQTNCVAAYMIGAAGRMAGRPIRNTPA